MTVLIITIVVAWILFSAFLVTIICVNSSRLSRIDEPFKDPAVVARARKKKIKEAPCPANNSTFERGDIKTTFTLLFA